ncbi:hypothetical protein QMO56_25615 [Roseomonas sp. E05]|uniref:hypothetical protein n=1 Tax=Roseomonas sp. E05 TaxID=3046310 RepID=UPI0024BB3F20|nr:hypothetical protein [Roseomonas sp. E05]MDJ0391485.1 hypothetical protein [Roseomonas sp. E05]
MSITRRSALASLLPIAAAPGLASAVPVPADPALTAYRAVMAQHDHIESVANEHWHLVEEWCDSEMEALEALADPHPVSLPAFLHRVIVLAQRLDDGAGWNMMQPEEQLLRSLAEKALAMLVGMEGGA